MGFSFLLPWGGGPPPHWVQEPGLPKKNSPAGRGRLLHGSRPVLFALFPIAPAAGWANIGTMKDHIEALLSGNPCGEVPPVWPRTNACTRCWVCGLGVSVRGASHLPTQPGPPLENTSAAFSPPGLPTMQEVHWGRKRTLRHTPAEARSLWNKTLTRASDGMLLNGLYFNILLPEPH